MKIFSIVCIVACLCGLVTSFRSLPHVPVSANKRSVSLRMTSDDQELRTYAGYNVYKGKGAINIKPIPPSFKINGKSQVVDRDGALLFEFAPIGNGPREYDWTKKAGFSMSVGECGEMMRAKDGVTTEFLHDPGAGSKLLSFPALICNVLYRHSIRKILNTAPDAGKMTKKLKWSPTPDGKG